MKIECIVCGSKRNRNRMPINLHGIVLCRNCSREVAYGLGNMAKSIFQLPLYKRVSIDRSLARKSACSNFTF